MIQVVLAVVVLGGVAAIVAAVLRRDGEDAPEQGASWEVPSQLDRSDFEGAETEWLVVVFASSTCMACAGAWSKAELLASDFVAVQNVDSIDDKDLHDRYGVEAVPMTLIADSTGAVRRSFLGEPTATDLWAAIADLREPGTVPASCTHQGEDPGGSQAADQLEP